MKKRTHNEHPPLPFEELKAAWERHGRRVDQWVGEHRGSHEEEVSRLGRWYAERKCMRRATLRRQLGVVAVAALLTGGGLAWLMRPSDEPETPLTVCEAPLPEALQTAVEPAPAPGSPSVPASRHRVRILPAHAALPEADESPCAPALLPDDGGDPAGAPSQSYRNMLCNNSCDPDSILWHIHFHYAGLPDEKLG